MGITAETVVRDQQNQPNLVSDGEPMIGLFG
jgi:hypothetical protein